MKNIRATVGFSDKDPRDLIGRLGVTYKFFSRHQYGESFIFWLVTGLPELPVEIDGIEFEYWDRSPLLYVGNGLDKESANLILSAIDDSVGG